MIYDAPTEKAEHVVSAFNPSTGEVDGRKPETCCSSGLAQLSELQIQRERESLKVRS